MMIKAEQMHRKNNTSHFVNCNIPWWDIQCTIKTTCLIHSDLFTVLRNIQWEKSKNDDKKQQQQQQNNQQKCKKKKKEEEE